jgi:ferredoxin
VVEELELDVVEFTPTVVRTTGVFPRLELAAEVMTADVLINLPKLKTHAQMFLSLAVKNLFGTVPGARKLQWHYRAGRDRLVFARMLNAVAQAGRPALSLVDAVWGMDSYGPTSGRARPVGFLAAGADPWAVDAVLMDVLGIERQRLFTLADASQNGPHGWETALAVGDSPEKLRPADWRLPELTTLQMHGRLVEHYLPGLASWLRERLAPPPYAGEGCDSCGTCRRLCPAGAIRGEGGKPEFDSRLCLRCYCCHELCPRGAMKITRGGLIQRLLGIAGED